MKTNIIKVGNSKGIRIPKTIIKEYNIEDTVELEFKEDHIILRPSSNPRKGWASKLKKMVDNNDDELLIPNIFLDEEL